MYCEKRYTDKIDLNLPFVTHFKEPCTNQSLQANDGFSNELTF